MNILLISTGSISAYKSVDLANSFRSRGHNVKVVLTEAAQKFITKMAFSGQRHDVYTDEDEWAYPNGVLHIDLARWADTIVVAPATLNTMAKYLAKITDNLALSVINAFRGMIYFAPAMNTVMYENGQEIFAAIKKQNTHIISPQTKLLACGDTGIGGLANKENILQAVLTPAAPIRLKYKGISQDSDSHTQIDIQSDIELPDAQHCGGFKYQRQFHQHEGIDLYCENGTSVYTCDSGVVTKIDWLTGEECNSPWWNSTKFVAIKHDNDDYISLYGELSPKEHITIGYRVKKGEQIGEVVRVLKQDKGRPTTMLHFEQYKTNADEIPFCADNDKPFSEYLVDPLPYLVKAYEKLVS